MNASRENFCNFFRRLPKEISDKQIEAAVIYWFRMLNSEIYSVDAVERSDPKAGFRKFIAADNKKHFFTKLLLKKPNWENDFKDGLSDYLKKHRFEFIILATDYEPEDHLANALEEFLPELLQKDIFPHGISMTFGTNDILVINHIERHADDIIKQPEKKSVQSSYFSFFSNLLCCPRLSPAIQNIRRSLGF